VAFVPDWVLTSSPTVTREVVGVFVRFRAPLHSTTCVFGLNSRICLVFGLLFSTSWWLFCLYHYDNEITKLIVTVIHALLSLL
jgi:hypothetical protein